MTISIVPKVDVLINAFSKPWQTAVSLLTLLQQSGSHIDKIYFHEEPAHSSFERVPHTHLLSYLKDRIVYYQTPQWIENTADGSRLQDAAYRLSARYQYGFEQSDKQYVLTIHNDIIVHADVVAYLAGEIGDSSGVGQIGQCWWCPAQQNKLCTPQTYEEYKPDFATLNNLYEHNFHPLERRAYHYGWGEQFKTQPWPLPECRLNEWCALIDRKKTQADTMPQGAAVPFGLQMPSGACIGENFDEPVNLDTAVQWFRDLVHRGHRFKHVNIYDHITHKKQGRRALLDAESYLKDEMMAKIYLLQHFPDFMAARKV